MSLAVGITAIDLHRKLDNPEEAPARFMIAMADAEENGIHIFLDLDEFEKFCMDGLKLTCDGSA